MATNVDAEKAGSQSAANCNSAPGAGKDDGGAEAAVVKTIVSPAVIPAQFDSAGIMGVQAWAAKVEPPLAAPASVPPAAASTSAATNNSPSQPRAAGLASAAGGLGSIIGNGVRRLRLQLAPLATTAALAAGVGAGGALATLCFERVVERPTIEATSDTAALAEAMARINADIARLKTGIDQSAKSSGAQMAKLAERLERNERALAEPNAKLAKLTDSIDRLDRRIAAASAAPVMASSAPVETTGAIPEPPLPQPAPFRDVAKAPVVTGWVLRNVYDGTALIEGRGGLVEVEPGDPLPGAGRVQAIRRQEGRWVVVTSKGLIIAR